MYAAPQRRYGLPTSTHRPGTAGPSDAGTLLAASSAPNTCICQVSVRHVVPCGLAHVPLDVFASALHNANGYPASRPLPSRRPRISRTSGQSEYEARTSVHARTSTARAWERGCDACGARIRSGTLAENQHDLLGPVEQCLTVRSRHRQCPRCQARWRFSASGGYDSYSIHGPSPTTHRSEPTTVRRIPHLRPTSSSLAIRPEASFPRSTCPRF